MNQSSSKSDLNDSNDTDKQSERFSPPTKRRCQTSNSKLCSSNQPPCVLVHLTSDVIQENKTNCKSCGKQEILLKTLNCPSLHDFCLNCIFNWTQKHVQTKTSPVCLVNDCGYLLKIEDLNNLPIAMKDHQILVQLIDLKISNDNDNNNNNKPINQRSKCDKCYLYIDQHNFFTHYNECLGRSLTIPCEICYCPVLINDYEHHMLICNNDDNSALSQFLKKHLQNPTIDEKIIKVFICSWQRKHRRAIDVYEMIEEFNQINVISNEICDVCKNAVRSDEFFFINCVDNHSLCLLCYRQCIQNQMNNNQILTCYQCGYHLQDKDLSETRIFNPEQIVVYQNYQNNKVLEAYNELYGAENTPDTNLPNTQFNETTANNNDGPRRKCDLCLKQHYYGNIFVLHCNCKICYDCFANDVNHQRATTDELLICSLCRSPIKHNDLTNLRLVPTEIQSLQLYQQGKLFEYEHAAHFNKTKNNQTINNINNNDDNDDDDFDMVLLNQQQFLPKYWTLPMLQNFSRHTLDPQSTEHKFVAEKFNQSWANMRNQVPMGVPVLPTLPTRTPLPQPPQPPQPPQGSAVRIRTINKSQPLPFQPGLLTQYSPLGNPINNSINNGSGTNQPPQNRAFPTLPYMLPPGTNAIVSSAPLPPHPSSVHSPHPFPPPAHSSHPFPPPAHSSHSFPPPAHSSLLPPVHPSLLPPTHPSHPPPPQSSHPPPQHPSHPPPQHPSHPSPQHPSHPPPQHPAHPPPQHPAHPPPQHPAHPPPQHLVHPPPQHLAHSSLSHSSHRPPPPIPFVQHQMYQPPISYTPPGVPTRMPMNNNVVTRPRRPRAVHHGFEMPNIIQIERIQNQRWYKQYSAHECEFRQKLGRQSEEWLFHGCDERSSKNIELECFNRSYAGQHAVAFGQGCYFARDSLYSHSYAVPDRNGIRRMFLVRVLIGNTTQGNSTMRVPPPGFDSTGDGQNIFVTYHDSQAYAEYLISYR